MGALVTLEVDNGVAYITLDRPDKLNAITIGFRDDLLDALAQVKHDPQVRCVVLRANGKAFCTGQDLGERAPITEGTPIDLGAALNQGFNRIVIALSDLPQPTIAAVQGAAVGAGASLALACDIVVASAAASFHFSFSRLGLVPDSGASWLLPRKIGMARATAIVLTATSVSAEQAHEWGLVTTLTDTAEALDHSARQMARSIAALPPSAVQDTKLLLRNSLSSDLPTQIEDEAKAQTGAGHSAFYKDALKAFLKRPR